MQHIIIRNETPNDYRAVEQLTREAFWNVYRPGCLEHYVIHCLRDDPAFVPELDFVMEQNGELIGQNMFMRAVIKADDGRDIPIMTMGPICIAPEWKRQGYGKILLETARTTGDSKALYLSLGYKEIPYYGSPAGAENCRCFLKEVL